MSVLGTTENSKTLTRIVIREAVSGHSVSTIAEKAFIASTITQLTLPKSITVIGEFAFAHCLHMISATFGHGDMTIQKSAFYGCANLRSVSCGFVYAISYCSVAIENRAFCGCKRLLHFEPDISALNENAFEGCSSLEYIDLEDNARLEKYALRGSAIKRAYVADRVILDREVVEHLIEHDILLEMPEYAAATELMHFGVRVDAEKYI